MKGKLNICNKISIRSMDVMKNRVCGGFEIVKKTFTTAVHFPIDTDNAPFAATLPIDSMQAIQTFSKLEKVINSLPKPILIHCKTGARASAIVAAMLGVERKLSWNQVLQQSEVLGLDITCPTFLFLILMFI